ncbi:flagellar basal body rod protein FlgG [Siminovitchia sp. FSL H7-0308]|uniref:Flagellar hook protein FlgE n=1 Tax=Siminovitchia thermophila TaxID=1245522 RepID=A0ABS2RCA7_9BACI|nr:flagellar basal body rod protein FlgG [Siminovitchia thermophila]MBM7716473.1 flagellar hook protein FlgE [Siminovitchia thermophila]ONK23233.1 flagellar basal body rod protein FlgG [Bacillus sp. VT-16-64]
MLRSMYAGISGMKNFQTKLDVIGNNIANVNTHGFKKGRITFQDMVSQTISGASGGGNNRGGVNPKQVGLGSQISAIETIDTQGSPQMTDRMLDVAIQGDGYLIAQVGNDIKYTRVGNLGFDQSGTLVTSTGALVLQSNGDPIVINDINQVSNISIADDGTVSFMRNGTPGTAGVIGVARFPNNGGLEKSGESFYIPTEASGPPAHGQPLENGAGKLLSGRLEMSNVDLSEEFTEMIIAQRGFQSNSRIITTSDEILQELVNLKR